jgi:Fic family protein
LLLCAEGVLREPLLYISLYFKQHPQRYYELLQSVRLTGDWETWLAFFFAAVSETAAQAADTALRLRSVAAVDGNRIAAIGRPAGSALRVHRLIQVKPLVSIGNVSTQLNLSIPTVTAAFKHLEKLGIVGESTGARYGRLYAYTRYLEILNAGTEPLPSK